MYLKLMKKYGYFVPTNTWHITTEEVALAMELFDRDITNVFMEITGISRPSFSKLLRKTFPDKNTREMYNDWLLAKGELKKCKAAQ